MSDRYLIFQWKTDNGGYGDRLIGLVTASAIAAATGRALRVDWSGDFSLATCLEQRLDAADLLPGLDEGNSHHVNAINWTPSQPRRDALTHRDLDEEWPHPVVVLEANMNLFAHLYLNPHYCDRFQLKNYAADSLRHTRRLYEEILVPTAALLELRRSWDERLPSPRIGIQVRTGDVPAFGSTDGLTYLSEEDLHRFYRQAAAFIEGHYPAPQEFSIFVTGDSRDAVRLSKEYIPPERVHFLDDPVIHFERPGAGEARALEKLILDHLLLASSNFVLLAHHMSNFGRTAALLSGAPTHVYRKKGAFEPLTPARLSSKEPLPFPLPDK